jgi:hypothetical protein
MTTCAAVVATIVAVHPVLCSSQAVTGLRVLGFERATRIGLVQARAQTGFPGVMPQVAAVSAPRGFEVVLVRVGIEISALRDSSRLGEARLADVAGAVYVGDMSLVAPDLTRLAMANAIDRTVRSGEIRVVFTVPTKTKLKEFRWAGSKFLLGNGDMRVSLPELEQLRTWERIADESVLAFLATSASCTGCRDGAVRLMNDEAAIADVVLYGGPTDAVNRVRNPTRLR